MAWKGLAWGSLLDQNYDYEVQFQNWLEESFPILHLGFSKAQVRKLEHMWLQSEIKAVQEKNIKDLEELANKHEQIIFMLSGKLITFLEESWKDQELLSNLKKDREGYA